MMNRNVPSIIIPILCLLFSTSLTLSSELKWFVSPEGESGGVSLNFPKTRERFEQKLSGKLFLEKSKLEENLEDGEGGQLEEGRREPKQFRLLSNFSDLIQSNSRLAPSSTFCKIIFSN